MLMMTAPRRTRCSTDTNAATPLTDASATTPLTDLQTQASQLTSDSIAFIRPLPSKSNPIIDLNPIRTAKERFCVSRAFIFEGHRGPAPYGANHGTGLYIRFYYYGSLRMTMHLLLRFISYDKCIYSIKIAYGADHRVLTVKYYLPGYPYGYRLLSHLNTLLPIPF